MLFETGVPNATLYLRQKVPVMRYPSKITEQSTGKNSRPYRRPEMAIYEKKTGGAVQHPQPSLFLFISLYADVLFLRK